MSPFRPSGILGILSFLTGLALCCQAHDQTGGKWPFDVVHLKNGKPLQGLIVQETPKNLSIRCVLERPGEPKAVVLATVNMSEIESIERLNEGQRQVLLKNLESLDRTWQEKQLQKLTLVRAPSLHDGQPAWSYESKYFTLVSDAREAIVRRAAFSLEQIYGAYLRYLPPRRAAGRSTRIILFRSLAEYQEELKKDGRDLRNPSLFDSSRNEILLASDLEKMEQDLERVRKEHQLQLERLQKAHVSQEEFEKTRRKIQSANDRNQEKLARAARRLYQTFYHEAFHAYVAQFVYSPGDNAELPRWLNEGLAQIFESAIIEAGELRLGHADPERLKQAKALFKKDIEKDKRVPLEKLLRAGADRFLVTHDGNANASKESYLTAWLLAFYLTFDQHKLGTPELDRYVKAFGKGQDPILAFTDLMGRPLPETEERLGQYLKDLKPSGSTEKPIPAGAR